MLCDGQPPTPNACHTMEQAPKATSVATSVKVTVVASKSRIQAALLLAYAYVPVPFAPFRNRHLHPRHWRSLWDVSQG